MPCASLTATPCDASVSTPKRNVTNAKRIVADVARALPARDCACRHALDGAIITPPDLWPEETTRELAPILSRRHAPEAVQP